MFDEVTRLALSPADTKTRIDHRLEELKGARAER
jgi:hypothetical protein